MKLVLRQLPAGLQGSARLSYLAPDAAESLLTVEREMGGLVYNELWRDASGSLLAKRQRRDDRMPGYSAANYGLAVTLNLQEILDHRGISYDELVVALGRRFWFCYRRDGAQDKPGSDYFIYLGQFNQRYLLECTQDPGTWGRAEEERLFERYGRYFQLTIPQVQELLLRTGLYRGEVSGQLDLYSREAVAAFQRAWRLPENGHADPILCRVLAFVTAEIKPS